MRFYSATIPPTLRPTSSQADNGSSVHRAKKPGPATRKRGNWAGRRRGRAKKRFIMFRRSCRGNGSNKRRDTNRGNDKNTKLIIGENNMAVEKVHKESHKYYSRSLPTWI